MLLFEDKLVVSILVQGQREAGFHSQVYISGLYTAVTPLFLLFLFFVMFAQVLGLRAQLLSARVATEMR